MAIAETRAQETQNLDDLRVWLNEVEKLGQLERIKGAHWNLEIGGLTEVILERMSSPPAVIFEDIPDHSSNCRILVNMLETMERFALAMNMPTDLKPMELIDGLRAKLRQLQPLQPRMLSSGPLLEEQETGDAIDLLRLPVPLWHKGDGGRYLGTGHLVVTRDPETGDENIGCYRVMVHGKDQLGLYISPGKNGRIHLEKAMQMGKPLPVAMVFGQHPLLFVSAFQAVPFGQSEYEWAGSLLGHPIQLVEGPLTGLRMPAFGEIAIEGEIVPGDTLPEGPFGEWTGYYASAQRAEPVVRVKAVYHRKDPIITGAPPFKPTIHGVYRSLIRSAMIWNAMEQAGVPDIRGVYLPPPAQRFMIAVAIRQRYPGHAKQAATVACQCHPGAYLGRYVVVVDDDIDITDIKDLLWAICTRSDPATSVDLLRRTWSGPLDPIIPKGQKGFNSRAIIDATRPWEWRDEFPAITAFSPEQKTQVADKWRDELLRLERAQLKGGPNK